jgi:CelD/BcsL family acetyltransferase involved in cellulose biosynthesis
MASNGKGTRTELEVHAGGIETIDRIADEWRELCTVARNDEPFYRPECFAAYLRAFDRGARLWLITARKGSKLTGVLPLVYETTTFRGLPVRKLKSPANVHSLRFDLLCQSGADGDSALRALWRFISRMSGWDMLEVSYVPQDGAFEQIMAAASASGFPTGHGYLWRTPYLLLDPGSPERDWERTMHGDHRRELRRTRRKFEALGNLRLKRITEFDCNALETLYRIEQSGWKGKAGGAIANHSDTKQFYGDLTRSAAEFGYFVFHSLELNGSCIAASIGMFYGSRFFAIKWAYDEQYSRLGPGHLLIEDIMGDCKALGATEFQFMGPWAEYKAKWANLVKPHTCCYIFRSGRYGRLLHGMKFIATPIIRRWLGKNTVPKE